MRSGDHRLSKRSRRPAKASNQPRGYGAPVDPPNACQSGPPTSIRLRDTCGTTIRNRSPAPDQFLSPATASCYISINVSATLSGKAAIRNTPHTKKYPTPTSAVCRPRRVLPILATAWR